MAILDLKNKEEVNEYKEFIRNSKYTSLTQDINWGLVKEGWISKQVYIKENGKIIAAASILMKKFILNYHFMYIPKGPVCNIENTEILNKLMEEIEKLRKEYKGFLIRFDPEKEYNKTLEKKLKNEGYIIRNKSFGKNELIQPRHNMVLEVSNLDEEELFDNLKRKTRYNIRLAKKRSVEVYHSNKDEDLKEFYNLYKSMTTRKEIGKRSYDYFINMKKVFGDNMRVYLAKHENDYISGGIAINYGDKIFNLYSGSCKSKQNLKPNYLMQWEMIRWAVSENKEVYDFGGVFNIDKNDGLYNFKENFCGEHGLVEFIGEIDKVYNPFVYKVFVSIVPFVQELKKKLKIILKKQ